MGIVPVRVIGVVRQKDLALLEIESVKLPTLRLAFYWDDFRGMRIALSRGLANFTYTTMVVTSSAAVSGRL